MFIKSRFSLTNNYRPIKGLVDAQGEVRTV